jgi:hypothetical protein
MGPNEECKTCGESESRFIARELGRQKSQRRRWRGRAGGDGPIRRGVGATWLAKHASERGPYPTQNTRLATPIGSRGERGSQPSMRAIR